MTYNVYCGKEIDGKNIFEITADLLESADLFRHHDGALFTDNYYTLINSAKELFIKYGMTLCCTITPTDKMTRVGHDVPFYNLSTGMLGMESREDGLRRRCWSLLIVVGKSSFNALCGRTKNK